MEYDGLGDFSPQELQFIVRNAHIFNNKDAELCPECNTNRSPATHSPGGMCLQCIEDRLKSRKGVSISHLPERWPAHEDVFKIAHEIIERRHEVAKKARIAYIFKFKHSEKNGKIVLGSCAKQSPKNIMLHGWDFIIEIAWDMWAMFDDSRREALLFHELCHIEYDDSQPKTASHDVEEFSAVIEAYGLWKLDLRSFAEAIKRAEEIELQKQGELEFAEV